LRFEDLESPEFSIEPLTQTQEDFLAGTREYLDDSDREELPYTTRDWITNAHFVLNYGNDYWVDHTGEVTSS
jgi:hypothetical protein